MCVSPNFSSPHFLKGGKGGLLNNAVLQHQNMGRFVIRHEAFGFLMKIKGRASGLTLREGAKRLPEELKTQVLSIDAKLMVKKQIRIGA
jgi:hypothetical protein